jgi:16S rRNA processing protein RimM
MSGAKERPAGPPSAGGSSFLIVGKVRRPHGVHGEVVAEIYSNNPDHFKPKQTLYLGEKHSKCLITSQRIHNEGLLLGFEGIDTPEQAGRFRNQILSITSSQSSDLPEGEYHYYELLGLEVIDPDGKPLGGLTEILETGANDVYVVTDKNGRELLLPAIPDVILNINLEAKEMTVRLIPGLIDNEK